MKKKKQYKKCVNELETLLHRWKLEMTLNGNLYDSGLEENQVKDFIKLKEKYNITL